MKRMMFENINYVSVVEPKFWGGCFLMNQIPTPLTLEELISYGAIEGSRDAYDDETGFAYSDPDSSLLHYHEQPFTGFYYELYQDGLPVEDYFEFYENGKIKAYGYVSEDRLNNYSYSFDSDGKLILRNVFEYGKKKKKKFDESNFSMDTI